MTILDKWTAKLPYHTTYYYIYNDGHNYDICVSKAVHTNGHITYAMSDIQIIRNTGVRKIICTII